jgi:uncharacterized membrane protein YeaQ/YmgE (transglycosylase-associated protein family)
MGILSWILFLLVAAVCAWMAERVVPSNMPGGIFANAVIGVLGAWIGSSIMGHFGPNLAGVSLFPTIIGSAVLVFGCALLTSAFRGRGGFQQRWGWRR